MQNRTAVFGGVSSCIVFWLLAGSMASAASALDHSLRRSITKTLYAWTPSARGFSSHNARQRLTVEFENGETRLAHPRGRVMFRLRGYGYGGPLREPGTARASVSGNRIEYHRGGIREWYLNEPEGIEQGFTLDHRPGPAYAGEALVIALEIKGELRPRISATGDAVLLESSDQTILRYGGLKAWDAHGRPVPSRFDLRRGELRLVVDDSAAEYPLMVDPTWSQAAQLTASDGAANDWFGYSVAVSGTTAIVGAPVNKVGPNPRQGAAYVFVRNASTWTQQAQLTVSEAGADEVFVWSVAVSGTTAVIGASYHDTASDTDQWAAYVFTRNGATWSSQAKLTAGEPNDGFGFSVAVSGTTAIVGAPFRGIGPNGYQGAADVFVQNGSTWNRQSVLTASDGGDEFGYSAAISGTTAIVGSPTHKVGSNLNQGAAYVFVQNGSASWSQQALLTASDGAAGDLFGQSVAISGPTAVVGAPYRLVGPSQPGAAYVFVRNGSAWSRQAQLTAFPGGAADRFGYSVAVSGPRAIVGAFVHDVGPYSQQGAAYLFVQNQNGSAWSQSTELTASDGSAGDAFGYSVAMSGTTAVVGAPGRQIGSNDSQGAAYIYSTPVSIAVAGGNTQSAPVGQPFLMPLQVKVADADGLGVPDVAVAFTPPVGGPGAALSNGGQATTGWDGIAAVAATANITVGGPYTVSASIDSGAVVASPSFSLTNIVGRASADITVSGGAAQSATVGMPFAAPLQVIVSDALGNPAPGVTVTFSAPGSGASAAFPDNGQVTTNSVGVATILPTANTKAGGPYAVTASIIGGAIVSSPGFSLINNAGPAVLMFQTSGAPNLAVTLRDQYGNPVPNQPVTFTVVPGPTGSSAAFASTPAQPILTGPDGTATAPVLTGNKIPGLFTVVASNPPPLNSVFLLNVKPETAPYQVSYAANLNAGDSYVNITNFGTVNGNDPAGVICVNVYVYDPNEEPVSCCACPVTPNGLRSLSVRNDLISNRVSEGSAPGSVVVKLLATAPVNGTCNAALTNNDTLARGMGAWMTTLHALTTTTPPTWQSTEPGFEPSELSDSELFKLRAVCGFIQTYASGFGLCRCK